MKPVATFSFKLGHLFFWAARTRLSRTGASLLQAQLGRCFSASVRANGPLVDYICLLLTRKEDNFFHEITESDPDPNLN